MTNPPPDTAPPAADDTPVEVVWRVTEVHRVTTTAGKILDYLDGKTAPSPDGPREVDIHHPYLDDWVGEEEGDSTYDHTAERTIDEVNYLRRPGSAQ